MDFDNEFGMMTVAFDNGQTVMIPLQRR
jgi:hypothetical protein